MAFTSNLHLLDRFESILGGLDFDVLQFTWQQQLVDDLKLASTIEN